MDHHNPCPRPATSSREPHPAVRAALQSLLVVLADPESPRVRLGLVDEVADAVSDLIDTDPPLQPLTYPAVGADDDGHALRLVGEAITQLERAVDVSADSGERLRAAVAVRQLRQLCSRSRP